MKGNKELSIVDLPQDIIGKLIALKLSLQDLARLARTSKTINSLFKKPLLDAKLARLLKHVAFGEQDQAEKILKWNPTLLVVKGKVIDCSGRTFNDITAFQYAVWALDWHMWKMILKYLPKNVAREQTQQFETGPWVKEHGVHAGSYIQRLLDAQQQHIDNYGKRSYGQNRQNWVQEVGSAQLLLPAHVIQEYCHPDRPFYPCPTFIEDTLPRNTLQFLVSTNNGSQIVKASGDPKRPSVPGASSGGYLNATSDTLVLGTNFAYYRVMYSGAVACAEQGERGLAGVAHIGYDRSACTTLMETRIHQRDKLVAQLIVSNQQIEISKQASSVSSTKEKAREFYHKGKTAFYTGDKSSAITFFLQAKDSYKDLLTNVELDLPSKKEAEKRLNKLKKPEGKYSPAKLTK